MSMPCEVEAEPGLISKLLFLIYYMVTRGKIGWQPLMAASAQGLKAYIIGFLAFRSLP